LNIIRALSNFEKYFFLFSLAQLKTVPLRAKRAVEHPAAVEFT
jgi:hypothetical protein